MVVMSDPPCGESKADPQPQSSMEQALKTAELEEASLIFHNLISYCEFMQGSKPYQRPTLVRLTYEYSLSKATFLKLFFTHLDNTQDQSIEGSSPVFANGLSRFSSFGSQATPVQKSEAVAAIDSFAQYLVDSLYLPIKAGAARLPRRNAARSRLSDPSLANAVGSPANLSALRRNCLARDRNRCVVTNDFNIEILERRKRNTSTFRNVVYTPGTLSRLAVSHIIPYAIMSGTTVDGEVQLNDSKKTAQLLLNMLDPDVLKSIEGLNIHHPSNAITLTAEIYECFALFQISFEATDGEAAAAADGSTHPRHTYTIRESSTLDFEHTDFPVTRTLLFSEDNIFDPPSARLLALHRAIAIILDRSGAGDYINKILRDSKNESSCDEGSTEIGRIANLIVDGWL
ncbi:hypothetical protein PABG_11454 [Paracoccidioides brasiliensis Pb03]|nr:hypothetical protein PABG_11454 [Paracoccidioides brasiliensis Pb03]